MGKNATDDDDDDDVKGKGNGDDDNDDDDDDDRCKKSEMGIFTSYRGIWIFISKHTRDLIGHCHM